MKKRNCLIGCLLLVLGCKNHPVESSAGISKSDSLQSASKRVALPIGDETFVLRTDEDSIRRDYDLSDSITLIKKRYIDGEPQYAFIIHSKKTVFHDRFKEMFQDFDESELEVYKQTYEHYQEKYKDSVFAPLDSYKDLVADWVPLYSYKGNFYVLSPCDFVWVRQLTDTTFVEHYMDGPAPRLILDVERDNNEVRMRITPGLLRFKLIDASRSIYLFSDGDGFSDQYLIPLQKVNEFPIIVEHCTEDGVSLVGFDRVRYDEQK